MQLPPPIHGASLVNKNIVDSELIKRSFNIKTIELRFVSDLKQMGRFSIQKILLIIPLIWRLIKTLIRFKPDLVYYTITPKGFAFYRDALLVSVIKISGINIAFHLHSRGIQDSISRNKVKKSIYKFVFKNTHIISLANSLNDEFDGLPIKSIHILPNGINDHQFNTSKREDTTPIILFLANLFRNKGIYVFLDIMKQLKEQSVDCKANIVGKDGDLSPSELISLTEQYGIADITNVSGALYGEQKYKAFEEASVFIHPSLDEAFPLTILEAMQAGTPIVGSSVGAIPEMIKSNITGFICQPGDVSEFSEKLKLLITDQSLRKRMGEECIKQFEQNYTMKRFENNLKNIIDDLLS